MEHILEYTYYIVTKKYKMLHDKEQLIEDYQHKYKTTDSNIIFPLIADDFLTHAENDLKNELFYQFQSWFRTKCQQDLNETFAHEIVG